MFESRAHDISHRQQQNIQNSMKARKKNHYSWKFRQVV